MSEQKKEKQIKEGPKTDKLDKNLQIMLSFLGEEGDNFSF